MPADDKADELQHPAKVRGGRAGARRQREGEGMGGRTPPPAAAAAGAASHPPPAAQSGARAPDAGTTSAVAVKV